MDILTCANCCAHLRPDETDVVKVREAGAHHQEWTNCCPHCHSVLSIEITMAEDDFQDPPILTEIAV